MSIILSSILEFICMRHILRSASKTCRPICAVSRSGRCSFTSRLGMVLPGGVLYVAFGRRCSSVVTMACELILWVKIDLAISSRVEGVIAALSSAIPYIADHHVPLL